MQIGAVGYPNYVYNTNYVSASSLNKVQAVPDDVLSSKIGYTGSAENENPLRPGESKDFVGIIASQMAMSRMNAARIMQPQQEEAEETVASMQGISEPADTPGMDVPEMDMAEMDVPEEIMQPTELSAMAWQEQMQAQPLVGAIEGSMGTAMLGA